MAKEHIAAGTKVAPGRYRCNACANQYECNLEEQLPMCPVCDSISWRSCEPAPDAGGKSNGKA